MRRVQKMAKRVVKPPAGVGESGRALWRSLHAALPNDVEFDEREIAILRLACRQVDDVAALEAVVERDGLVVDGAQGQPRLSQVVSELRQGRLAAMRLLGELHLPDVEQVPRSLRSQRAQRAADARWDQVAARRARRGA
jgi:hypothetical protein